ncbi:MAG: NADH dehydrogenase [ubiquinone] 1 alpha subcomplex assembly factor 1 [Paraglaciecola sp.]|jgi:NADH dehydrogenase [ubiquinone] 1 alpha subcomplex assembly factor 1
MMLGTTVISAESCKASENPKPDTFLLSFTKEQHIDDWKVTNDGVMGGLSVGKIQLENQAFIFSGSISTENNGGFTSVYRPIEKLPEEFESVRIRVKGDGKLYQLRMRSQVMDSDITYKINFATKDSNMQTLNFNLADFQASFRGRVISGAPILKAETISHVGFLITTKQAGHFSLSSSAIEFY